MNNIILQCINLSKSYQDDIKTIHILKNVSFCLNKSDIAVIIGKSGSGKSTFLHLISGLEKPTFGTILFDDIPLNSMSSNQIAKLRNSKLGFIYQFHHLLLDFNVLENVAMPLLISNKSIKEAKEKSYEILMKINLGKKINKYPSELSGGERQRVAIARAFVNKPKLIIADEPTGNLDAYNARIIFDLIFELNNNLNTSFLIVTHDLFLANKAHILYEIKNAQLNIKKNIK
ncbi:lipoprotein-releasing ABC transporter ATP-binding protein LolD [Buchnera aphidicola (Aphis craccivore)]|uniref:Lipoprotein-releasing system ATP-binding protein LolD n=1 Tax=Buchnera aphidicola (Aphis craccivora) TaxID=466616 RepID=A0AA95IYE7_9GAMM|nr:lipoprotein-releasing ABC transporter ATP-binding protein LolD [Buchnera aphidicola]QLL40675.1 lipoprotein-releasing ABC transporter ATP-binding protein LolD [Buchnera aphidicola (Aphis craccivore)]WAI17513.1 MAG: lipoprotein-releasing ABC transporter ATP-binding protein LolD [Buchnera aphidicola (Aphis craccivora)]